MGFTAAKKRLNGSFGYVQADGEDWGEINGIEVKISAKFEDVQRGMDLDGKMVARSGTGKITMMKAFSRARKYVEDIKAGKTPSMRIVAWVADPDLGGAEERVAISNVNITELPVIKFEHGGIITDEIPFTFSPCDLTYLDSIDAN